jgi:hypothetical protein
MRITRRQLRQLISESLNEQDETTEEELVDAFIGLFPGVVEKDENPALHSLLKRTILSSLDRSPEIIKDLRGRMTDETMTALEAFEWIQEKIPMPPALLRKMRDAFKAVYS